MAASENAGVHFYFYFFVFFFVFWKISLILVRNNSFKNYLKKKIYYRHIITANKNLNSAKKYFFKKVPYQRIHFVFKDYVGDT